MDNFPEIIDQIEKLKTLSEIQAEVIASLKAENKRHIDYYAGFSDEATMKINEENVRLKAEVEIIANKCALVEEELSDLRERGSVNILIAKILTHINQTKYMEPVLLGVDVEKTAILIHDHLWGK